MSHVQSVSTTVLPSQVLTPARRWLVFGTVVMGAFMVNVDASIVNVALPVLQSAYHASAAVLQWVISGYLLVITAILPGIGGLSDRVNRKWVFVVGVGLFSMGSALCGMAGGMNSLITYRMIQALGGAVIMGNVMSIVASTFPAGQRGRPLGFISSVVAAGTIVGPALGGVMIAAYGWRSIFWINVPIGILAMVLSSIFLSNLSSGRGLRGFAWGGAVWFALAMMTLLLFVSNGHTWGWLSLQALLIAGVSAVSWSVFIVRSLHTVHPLIEISLFQSSRFTVGNLAGLLTFMLMMFPGFMLPLFLRIVLNEPIAHVGWLLMSQALAMIVVAPIGGWIADHHGSDPPAFVGMVVIAISLVWMATFHSGTSPWSVVLAQGLFGVGNGLFQSPNNVSILETVPVEKTGLTGSLMATIRNFGRVFGVAFVVLLLQSASGLDLTAKGLDKAMPPVFVTGAVLAVLAALLVGLRTLLSRWHTDTSVTSEH